MTPELQSVFDEAYRRERETAIPAQELADLAEAWRRHGLNLNRDARLALHSCALDLDRLRESYAKRRGT